MTLRAIAVSAPDWIAGHKGANALNSSDPASLFNACRLAASLSTSEGTAWADSNWAGGRAALRGKFLLMYSLDDMSRFEALVMQERPNLILIGAMTLCLPGAAACASLARRLLGDSVFIVLGGRHSTETVYLEDTRHRTPNGVRHHAGSPVTLAARGRLQTPFDAVVSGDGEHVVVALGEAVAAEAKLGKTLCRERVLSRISTSVPGSWLISWADNSRPCHLVSVGAAIDYDRMPSPAAVFGVSAAFPVFAGRRTAHVFSDIGRGCVYDCNFCSERSSVTGAPRSLSSSARRLYRQMKDAVSVIQEDSPSSGASAFVEDSVLLGGSPKLIDNFLEIAGADPIDIQFGGQLTIDQILSRRAQIKRLAQAGLKYLFVGVETLSPNDIGGMSKDLGGRRAPWIERIHEAFDFMAQNGIGCGCALLFGLGESHASRLELLDGLANLQRETGMPHPVSANWAVQHPLCGMDGGASYDYLDWGTPAGPFLDCFQHFGEASVLYPLKGVSRPVLTEVEEITSLLLDVE